MTVKEARQKLHDHYKKVEGFYDDPMTEAIGAPTGDFQADFDRQEKKLLGDLHRAARAENDKGAEEEALAGFEKWMP